MAKFDFNNTVYNKIWDSIEGRRLTSILVNDPELVFPDPQFEYWRTAFPISNEVLPTSVKGDASFTVEARYPTHSTLMDMRAPLGDTRTAQEGQIARYSGSIAQFSGIGFIETARERDDRRKRFEKYGDEAGILQGFAEQVLKPRIDAANQTLTNMAIQAETTGKVSWQYGVGAHTPIYNAGIPSENKIKGGVKAWTDPACKLLDQMVAIEKKFKEEVWGSNFAMQWKVDYDTFHNVILKNAQVIDTIKTYWLASKGQLISEAQKAAVGDSIITEAAFNTYVVPNFEGLSPIKVISTKQWNNGVIVNPWPDGIAVLQPAGPSGETLHTDLLDEYILTEYGNNINSYVFSTALSGLLTIQNSVIVNGNLKEWHQDYFLQSVPVIKDWLWRVLVSYKEADA